MQNFVMPIVYGMEHQLLDIVVDVDVARIGLSSLLSAMGFIPIMGRWGQRTLAIDSSFSRFFFASLPCLSL